MGTRLVLASASPRRRALLAELGIPFEVMPSDVPETRRPDESPRGFAQRVAREKALEVARRRPDAVILAADTIVVVDTDVLGKPRNRDDARRMLRTLSGRSHRVLTAVAVVHGPGAIDECVVESGVEFRHLEPDDIERYLDSGEPFDKAGAYAVQGLAKQFIVAVRGSHSNVIGLPMDEVTTLLRRHQLVADGAYRDD